MSSKDRSAIQTTSVIVDNSYKFSMHSCFEALKFVAICGGLQGNTILLVRWSSSKLDSQVERRHYASFQTR
jgi:hypothetical protein